MTRSDKHSRLRLEPGPNNSCFVCGKANPHGLRLAFELDERNRCVRGRFRLGPSCQGPRGFVHGGIIAAVLDEAMGKIGRLVGARAVTAALEVRYLRPIRLGEEIVVEARASRQNGRSYHRRAEIRNASGKLAAQARGRFVAVESRPRSAF